MLALLLESLVSVFAPNDVVVEKVYYNTITATRSNIARKFLLIQVLVYIHSHDTMMNPVYVPPDALEDIDSGVNIEDEITVNKGALDSD